MKEMCVRDKKSKLSLYSMIVLGTLALVVIAALSSAAYAALDNTDNENKPLSGQMVLFDPFTLRTITPVAETSSGTVILSSDIPQPQIWIPSRPPLRSPYRPPWVPGPPPRHPGPPPWHPGPPPWPPGPPQ